MKELSCIGRLNCTIQTRRRDEKLKYNKKDIFMLLFYYFAFMWDGNDGMFISKSHFRNVERFGRRG